MDFNEINTLLSIVHMSNDVDSWFGDQARRRLNQIKAAATKPAAAPAPRQTSSAILTSVVGERKL